MTNITFAPETEARFQRIEQSIENSKQIQESTDRKLDRIAKQYGHSENNKGAEVEEFFYRYFQKHRQLGDTIFDEVNRNIIASDDSEHDIALINGEISALISVKHKLSKKHIDYVIEQELPRLKRFYHKIGSHHQLLGGVAGYIVPESVEIYAQKKGLYVLIRAGSDVSLRNPANFKPRAA